MSRGNRPPRIYLDDADRQDFLEGPAERIMDEELRACRKGDSQ